MPRTIKINCVNTGKELFLPNGITLREISEQIADELGFVPIAAKVNNRMESLDMELYHPKMVEFISVESSDGRHVYLPSLMFLVSSAFEEMYPDGTFKLSHISAGSMYCTYSTGLDVDETEFRPKVAELLTERTRKLCEADIPIEQVEDETAVVVERFRKAGREDIVLLLENYHDLYAAYYKMGQHIEYSYVPLVCSTRYISEFSIEPFRDGLMISVPTYYEPAWNGQVVIPEQELDVCCESEVWNRRLHASCVGEINSNCMERRGSGWLIKVAESMQERKIAQIAEAIVASGKRVVLIAGPSSSGKTTFSKRLEVALETIGRESYSVSLDDFFVNRTETPRDEKGAYDYECLEALDLNLFNSCLKSLLAGEPVDLPTYNFVTGIKEYREHNRQLSFPGCTFVIEGLHGLNPKLLTDMDPKDAFRIYVSPITSLSLDNHVRITATDNRLMRRISRDAVQRNRSARETLAGWGNVRSGEIKWIHPFRENADVFFNTALVYEIAVIKPFVEDLLREVPQNCPEYAGAERLLKMLAYLVPLSDKEIPPTSIIREFVGGSSFRY